MEKRTDEEVQLAAENLRQSTLGYHEAGGDFIVEAMLIQAHWLNRIFEALCAIEMDLRQGRKG